MPRRGGPSNRAGRSLASPAKDSGDAAPLCAPRTAMGSCPRLRAATRGELLMREVDGRGEGQRTTAVLPFFPCVFFTPPRRRLHAE